MLKNPITKSEQRECLARKAVIKKNKGGTLAGQINRACVNKNYAGAKKLK